MKTLAHFHRLSCQLFTGSLLLSLVACRLSDNNMPVAIKPIPAQIVAGTYQAQTFTMGSAPEAYPINGQTVTIQLKALTDTTVRVEITAPVNDKYSPGKNVSYTDIVVGGNPINDASSAYRLVLDPTTRCGYNALNVYSQGRMDYYYIPPGGRECNGATIRLGKQ